MKKLVLILLFVPLICFTQNSSHIISGIDLNKDWSTLTNQSTLSYYSQEVYRKKLNLEGVSMEIDENYLNSYVDKDFLSVGFTDLVLNFPMENQSNLNTLEPTIFMATKKYDSNIEYSTNSSNDFNKIVYLLMNQFGTPNSTMKKSWGASFEWNFSNAQLILNSNKSEHITLMYLKNSR